MEERATLTDEWDAGKAYILAEFEVRNMVWQQLPLKLCCLGHWDIRKAREHVSACLLLFEDVADLDTCHPLTRELLERGGPSATNASSSSTEATSLGSIVDCAGTGPVSN